MNRKALHRQREIVALRIAKRRSAWLERATCESLEDRVLLSGGSYLDRIDFGNASSEATHNFDVGAASLPVAGTGALGQTYRQPYGTPGTNHPYGNASGVQSPTDSSQSLTFTLNVDPTLQNYIVVKLWGSDTQSADLQLAGTPSTWDAFLNHSANETAAAPNRFYYVEVPIPIAMTTGLTSAQLTLYESNSSSVLLGFPIYSAFSSTDPYFTPDSADAQSSKLTSSGQITNYAALTASQVSTLLQAERSYIFSSGGYFSSIEGQQAIVLSSAAAGPGNTYTWSAPTGAPAEAAGLDLYTNVASWMSANPSATAEQWRDRIAGVAAGAGYTPFPDELLSVLSTAYTTSPFVNASGTTVPGLDDYHDASLIARMVAAIDGSSYMIDSDGLFIQQGGEWTGLTSTARTSGSFVGSTARQATNFGGGDLQGVDTYELGNAIITLLNDPTAAPIVQTYLAQSYDANLTAAGANTGQATSVMRATAWERMLYTAENAYAVRNGGTESQNLFQMVALVADQVALEKLQALFPNSAYPAFAPNVGLNYAQQVLGLAPDTLSGPGTVFNNATNYGLSAGGIGEAEGLLSSGYDGGYGQIIPWLAPRIAQFVAEDPGLTSSAQQAAVANVISRAKASIDTYDQFIYPQENYNATSNTVAFTLAPEAYITYRNVAGLNSFANQFNVNAQYVASDPNGGLNDAYSLRAAYLMAAYGQTPIVYNVSAGASLNYLKDLSAYESTLRSLINVNPATLTALPGETGHANSVSVDVQTGATSVYYNGEKFFLNANWRNGGFGSSNVPVSVSDLARIEYDDGTTLRGALIEMPFDSTTILTDGNITGGVQQAWVVRYGQWLIMGNPSGSAATLKLPTGAGLAKDLVTGNTYQLGTSLTVAAGAYAVLRLDASNTVGSLGTGVDVGLPGVTGSDSYAKNVYTLAGAGDIAGTSDAFHFVSSSVSGNASVSAKVLSQTASDSLAQAGVMIRSGTNSTDPFAAVVRTAGNGVRFEWRSAAGGAVAWAAVPSPSSAVFVKLLRNGTSVSGYSSTDGVTWTQIGTTQAITLGASAQLGLAVSSHNTSATSTATFSNLTIGLAPSVVTPATASSSTVTGTTVSLSTLGSDAGGEASLVYNWALLGAAANAVKYSANGTNAAKNTTVTFAAAGTYTFQSIITNATGVIASSTVTVAVTPTLTGVSVTPSGGTPTLVVPRSGTLQLIATPLDQFGMAIRTPLATTWAISSGIGAVSAIGIYTAPASGNGAVVVRATIGSTSGTVTLTVPASVGIFTATQDIGSPSVVGSASYSGSTYTVAGSGSDVWDNSDQFRFVYVPLTGDGTLTAKVLTESNTNTNAKAGVMFRASLDAASANVALNVTPTNGLDYDVRFSSGASTSQQGVKSIAAPYWVRLVRSGNSFTAYYSSDGTTWTQNGTANIVTMGSTIYAGLFVCSHTTNTSSTATFNNVTLTPTAHIFKTIATIGGPTVPGTYVDSTAAATATLTAQAGDIWGPNDQFEYGYTAVTGSATLIARVTSQTNTGVWAKAGLMIRKSAAANSAFVDLVVTPSTVSFQWRSTDGQDLNPTGNYVNATGTVTAPVWLKLVRSGSTINGYYSTATTTPTAAQWIQLSSQTVTMGTTALVGLAMTSNNTSSLGTATYTNIALTGTANVAPTISKAAAAAPATVTGTTAALTVTGADSDGGTANLTYTWAQVGTPPAAVAFSANGTNAAASTTVTFSKAGTYLFQVTVADTGAATAISGLVTVTVNQTLTSILVTPALPAIGPNATDATTATALDQFGNAMVTQPASFAWSLTSGSGSVSTSTGTYTAPAGSTTAVVTATTGSIIGSASVTVNNAAPVLTASTTPSAATPITGKSTTLTVSAADDGGAAGISYFWSVFSVPSGAASPIFSGASNGTNAASSITATFAAWGQYVFNVQLTDAGGASSIASLTVNVAQTPTTVSVSPASFSVAAGASQALTAAALDQFGQTIAAPALTWSTAGNNSIATTASGATFTAGSTAGVYAVTATAAGGASGSSSATVTAASPAPTLSSTQINDGSAQRSMVTSFTLTFSRAVSLASGAVSIALHGSVNGGGSIGTLPALAWATSDGGLTYIITFTGSSVVGGSIADGVYDLTLHANLVTDASNGQTLSGGDSTMTFFRLFGDSNGDGAVNNTDYARFRSAYGQSAGDPNYTTIFDYDVDGAVNNTDYAAFRKRYGTSYDF